jgi:hypothetical protein
MATALHPQQYVPGPARVPIKFGLFSVLDFRGTPDTNWEGGGERWQSFNGTPELGIIGPTQQLESDILGNTLSFTPSTDIDTAGVFTVYGQDRVTPGPGWSGDQAKQRARDFLAALEERAAEMALAGVVAGLTPNMSTAPSAGSSIDLIQVIALLEGYLADHYGSLGVIHMSRSNAHWPSRVTTCSSPRATRCSPSWALRWSPVRVTPTPWPTAPRRCWATARKSSRALAAPTTF